MGTAWARHAMCESALSVLMCVVYISVRPGRVTECDPMCSRTPSYQFWFYQAIRNALKMGTESVPDMSLHILTLLSAREHLIEFCRRESYNTYIFQNNSQQILVFRRFGCP